MCLCSTSGEAFVPKQIGTGRVTRLERQATVGIANIFNTVLSVAAYEATAYKLSECHLAQIGLANEPTSGAMAALHFAKVVMDCGMLDRNAYGLILANGVWADELQMCHQTMMTFGDLTSLRLRIPSACASLSLSTCRWNLPPLVA